MTEAEKDQLEGFNAGYIIEKHRPELAQQLVEGLNGVDEPFIEGFLAGSQEFAKEREVIKSKTISKLKGYGKGSISRRAKDRDKGIDLDR